MSEPLDFDAETRVLHDALFPNEYRHARPFLIHAALREAAAKALEWSRTAGFSAVLEAISALRTQSAPNAPKEAE